MLSENNRFFENLGQITKKEEILFLLLSYARNDVNVSSSWKTLKGA